MTPNSWRRPATTATHATNVGVGRATALDRPDFDIYLSPPDMGDDERRLLLEAFDSNWIAPLGPAVDAFEEDVARFVGARNAVALSSGTAALHLSLLLVGVRPRDEVVTSTFTFVATANAINYVGARPTFIDVDPLTWTMDPGRLEDLLERRAARGRRPAAVMPVDLYGRCAEYDEIIEICRRFEVPVVEDAAEALGATYQGRAAGTFGVCGVFSFNGNKIITAGGGGMLVTEDDGLARQARFLATQARDPAPHYEHSQVGFNYRMSNLLAAVGRGQLRGLPGKIERRRGIRASYRRLLEHVPGIEFPHEPGSGRSNAWLTCVLVDPQCAVTSDDVLMALRDQAIEARPVWKPLHLQPLFQDAPRHGGEVAEGLFERGLCLPSGSGMTDHDVHRVAAAVSVAASR